MLEEIDSTFHLFRNIRTLNSRAFLKKIGLKSNKPLCTDTEILCVTVFQMGRF